MNGSFWVLLYRAGSARAVSNICRDLRALKPWTRMWGVAFTAILGSLVAISSARAHVAPSGWAYPYQCCSDRDCQPVHGTKITEGPDGYVVQDTGEIIGYQDPRLKNSPDGEFHLCAVPGNAKSGAICLFVPPRAS